MDLLNPEYNIQKTAGLIFRGHRTQVKNIKENSLKTYNSIRLAAKDLNINYSTIFNYINNNKLLRDTYLITK